MPSPRRDPDSPPSPHRDPDAGPQHRRDPETPHRDPNGRTDDRPVDRPNDRTDDRTDTDQPNTDRPDGTNHDGTHRDPDSDTPHNDTPDNDRPDADRPSIDDAHARHGETTPAGISHHRGDPDMGDLPHRVPADPRYFTADVHITPDGRARIGNHTYTPEQYGDLLRRNGWDGKTPIRLIGCDAGTNNFANRLSTHTGADVLAPTKPAWTDSNGRVYTSDAEIGPDGNRQPKIPPNGEWNTHRPDGSSTKASDDGFAPGTGNTDKQDLDPTDAKDRGEGDDPRDGDDRDRYRSDEPEPPASPEAKSLGKVDESRWTAVDDQGRVTEIDNIPVKEWMRGFAERRGHEFMDAKANGTVTGAATGNCVGWTIDRRTGEIFEGANGRRGTTIPPDEVHPLIQKNVDEAQAAGPYTAYGNDGQPMLENGAPRQIPYPHDDPPLRHAEVRATNEALMVRENARREELDLPPYQHGDHSVLTQEALEDMRIDVMMTKNPGRESGGLEEAPCCANCNLSLKGVQSGSGRWSGDSRDPNATYIDPE
jgi:hypothetical protein